MTDKQGHGPMTLRRKTPQSVKVLGRRLSVALGERTAGVRLVPSFVMVGAQRAGTTSLYRALMAHPAVLPPVHHKGVNYFDVNYHRGMNWYLGHFPTMATARLRTSGEGAPQTFEASGYYMFHPLSAARLTHDLPQVKVIAMLRDPVERAYSAYQHEFARGFEVESFARALELEDERIERERARMVEDPAYQSAAYRHQAYRRRGHYAEQLRAFAGPLGADRVLVVESADFFGTPETEYRRITDFLGLPPFTPDRFDRYNARPRQPMDEQTAARLRAYFEPHDAELAAFMGRTPSWRR